MAFREVRMEEIKEVLRRWLAGDQKKAIARQVGVARNTVRRYIEAAEGCGVVLAAGPGQLTDARMADVVLALDRRPGRERGDSWALCVANRDFLAEHVSRGVRLSKVRKLLARRGVVVPYPTLHRYATAELGFGRKAPTIPVADCEPGQEVQLDTGWMTYLPAAGNGRRRFRAWIFTAVRSRHRFVYATFRETTADAIEACEAAWLFFGGVFAVVIPDNTKSIVQIANPLEPLINRTFLEYSQARGFVIDPARAKHPKDKARVERSVTSVRDDCYAGEVLATIDQARQRGAFWCLHDYGVRRHTRTQRLPLEHFEAEEKGALLPPPVEPYDVPAWSDPKVGRDQHAQVAKAIYSLPREYRGKEVHARADRTTVRFYKDAAATGLIKACARLAPGGRHTDPSDFPPEQAATALRDVDSFRRWAAKHGPAVGRFAARLLEGPLPWTRMRQVYALLGYCRRYGDDRVNAACERALEEDMHDVRRLERMLKLGGPLPVSEPVARVLPFARYLRPSSTYALPIVRHQKGDLE